MWQRSDRRQKTEMDIQKLETSHMLQRHSPKLSGYARAHGGLMIDTARDLMLISTLFVLNYMSF